MLTKNWFKNIATLMFCKKASSWKVGLLNYTGSVVDHYLYNAAVTLDFYGMNYLLGNIRTTYSDGVLFGTGNTAATVDDYKLSGNIITTLSGNVIISRGSDADGAYIEALYTVTNIGSSDVTVSEIGTFIQAYTSNCSYDYVMIDRTVLETPVTIPANGVGQVTYTIRMVYPTE